MAVPGILEERLLGELVLGVQHEDLGLGLVLLQIVRDHAHPLVGTGRAAVGVGRRRHHHRATVLHGLELRPQQRRLLAGLVGVGHDHGGRLVVALDGVVAEVDARRDDEGVVVQHASAGEPHLPLPGVHLDRHVAVVDDTVLVDEIDVAMRDRFERPPACEIEIAVEAGGVGLLRFHQGHLDLAGAVVRHVLGDGGAAGSAADHHHPGPRLCPQDVRRRDQRRRGDTRRGQELPSAETRLHGHDPPFRFCSPRYSK
ncbi:hypothetical protein HRbin39_01904 [bacterium HR39]|nr:hypothetical protein HRbin39_01904 [bacterium HR39]